MTNKLIYHPFPSNITAFSTTRTAGGNGIHPWRLAENRRVVALELGIKDEQMVVPHQTHTSQVLWVDEDFLQASPQEQYQALEQKDAVVTHLKEVCVCVSTADCIPVLLYDRVHQVVAAIHAGWRGTCARIVEKALACMHSRCGTLGSDVLAVIGPGISIDAFEVGDEVYEAFQQEGFPMSQMARRYPAKEVPEKWHIDLWECNRLQLLGAGVPAEQITVSGVCTVQQSDRFFSARALGVQSGRILNGIIIRC